MKTAPQLEAYGADYVGGDIGGGAHGMCGHLAARSALNREFGVRG